jgi:asparagine synthase (glutamine-hydrolysing)
MTAFAAVLSPDGVSRDDAARVSAELAAIYRTAARTAVVGGCTLMTSPLCEPGTGPFIDTTSGIAVAGQILLEGTTSLRRELGQPSDATDIALVASAYGRWSTDCTRRLSGEFGFALWDSRRRLLLSARDGFGIRLVYIGRGPRVTIVTNILGAALALPGIVDDLDERAVIEFLAEGAPGEGRTSFRAVRCLPAGHTLCVRSPDNGSLTRHWWFPQPRRSIRTGAREIIEGYRAVLEEAVRDRVRTKAASIFFSGGIDSTTIAAAGRRAVPSAALRVFTAVFRRLPSHDEISYARAAAERLAIPLVPVAGGSFEALDHLARPEPPPAVLLDEPTLSDWRSLLGAGARHSPVGLYGEDGDTLFSAPGWRALRHTASAPTLLGAAFRFAVAHGRLPYLGIRLRERLGLAPDRTLGVPAFLSAKARHVLQEAEPPTVFDRAAEPLFDHPTRPLTQRQLCTGAGQHLAPLIAAEVTRQRMELRFPLLDTRLVQFVIDVPAIPWCQGKLLPRRAYRGDLPDAVLDRPKTPLAGMHGVLLAGWRRTRTPLPVFKPDSPVLAWIDMDEWRRALDADDVFEVGLAWRVLQLQHWLARRHELRHARASAGVQPR